MGCLFCPTAKRPAPQDAACEAIFGSPACRRLSLDGPRPQKAGAPRCGGGAAAWPVVSVTAASMSSPLPGGLSCEFAANPLRRLSLPMAGQLPRPVEQLRRASLEAPGALSLAPAASCPAAAAR